MDDLDVSMYRGYGLTIQSALRLPELLTEAKQPPDVVIRFDTIRQQQLAPGPCEDYLSWESVGRFLVREGREILIQPAPGVDEATVRLPLLGSVLATLLRQRGYLVLHGSAVVVGDGAAVFLANKGCGKSTLAATMYRLGCQIIADDVVALDLSSLDGPQVLPGFPQLKLWPDAVRALGGSPSDLPCLAPDYEKRAWVARDRFCRERVPLRRVNVLAIGPELESRRLRPQDALQQVIAHSYFARLGNQALQGTDGAKHFRDCAGVVRSVAVNVLQRPPDLGLLPSVAEMIHADLAPRPAVPSDGYTHPKLKPADLVVSSL